eukprot:snap_masked-scaffold_38-processed-gene-2.68-mRNA-1 protein AED:1.00 eAED:1.00 QI:0/0/0/0/1/1/2/0/62
MTFDEKSILKQYKERKEINKFKIEWSSEYKKESEKFNKAIRTFLRSIQESDTKQSSVRLSPY